MRTTRKARKRLKNKSSCQPTRCIMAALISIGGGQGILPAMAVAQETTIDDDTTYANSIVHGNHEATDTTYTSYTGDPNNNVLTITKNGKAQTAYGGRDTGTKDVEGNTLIIDGKVRRHTYGGSSKFGNANNNTVNISGEITGEIVSGETYGHVWGGLSQADGNANGNKVNLTGGQVLLGNVYGGRSDGSGDTENNEITVTNGTIISTSIAGYSENGNSRHNTYTVNSGTVGYIVAGRASTGIAEDNQTIINGGTVGNMAIGGETATGTAQNNTITINNGTLNEGAYGAVSHGTGSVKNNTVNVKGGTINSTASLYNAVVGGFAPNGIAIGNTVNLYTLNDNINGNIRGGKGITSSDNTVNFLGTANLPNATLDGSTIQNLNVYTTNNYVNSITGNIENLHFYLPASIRADDTMLTVNTGATDLTGSTVNWTSQTRPNIEVSERVYLIRDANGLLTTNSISLPGPRYYTNPTGISVDTTYTYTTHIAEDAKSIYITLANKKDIVGTSLPARTRSLVETRTAMTSLLNGGSDFVATQVMDEAEAVAIDPEISVVYGRLVPFAVFGGGYLNLDSGADVDLNSYYVNLGLTKEIKNRNGSLYLGPIFEYGHGSYDSYLDSGIHGWGKGHYVGGGFFARQRNHDGFYYEGDLRAGRFKSDYQGNLAEGLNANYTTEGSYIAAHLGLGKVFKLNQTDTMDTYLKYFFSRTSGDDVNIHSNLNEEMFNFDSVNSHRLRIGARYYHPMNKSSKFYAGLAYQYEFGGEATATHDGLCTPAPSLRGSSGMAELGLKVTSGKKVPMTLDLGVSGWVGKQKGVMGRLKLSWAF